MLCPFARLRSAAINPRGLNSRDSAQRPPQNGCGADFCKRSINLRRAAKLAKLKDGCTPEKCATAIRQTARRSGGGTKQTGQNAKPRQEPGFHKK